MWLVGDMSYRATRLLAGAVLLASAAGLTVAAGTARAATAPTALVGTFSVTPGSCSGSTAAGSWFRMVLPSGATTGPFVGNNDSACGDQTYTLLSPGTDGGLLTGSYQPEPTPAFDSSGNSQARRIIAPVGFYGKKFSADTAPRDPQTQATVSAPTITASGTALSGDLRAFAASWNVQEFNQGAPKPDGSKPGITASPSGTYDASTGAYSLTWASQIVGGPFNNFTGLWHLTGTFHSYTATASWAPASPAAAHASPAGTKPTVAPTTPVTTSTRPATTHTPGAAATSGLTPVAVTSRDAPAPSAATSTAAAPAPPVVTGGTGGAQVVTSAAAKPNPAHGWRAPVWAILLVTAIGVLGAAVYVALDRALRRTEAS